MDDYIHQQRGVRLWKPQSHSHISSIYTNTRGAWNIQVQGFLHLNFLMFTEQEAKTHYRAQQYQQPSATASKQEVSQQTTLQPSKVLNKKSLLYKEKCFALKKIFFKKKAVTGKMFFSMLCPKVQCCNFLFQTPTASVRLNMNALMQLYF